VVYRCSAWLKMLGVFWLSKSKLPANFQRRSYALESGRHGAGEMTELGAFVAEGARCRRATSSRSCSRGTVAQKASPKATSGCTKPRVVVSKLWRMDAR